MSECRNSNRGVGAPTAVLVCIAMSEFFLRLVCVRYRLGSRRAYAPVCRPRGNPNTAAGSHRRVPRRLGASSCPATGISRHADERHACRVGRLTTRSQSFLLSTKLAVPLCMTGIIVIMGGHSFLGISSDEQTRDDAPWKTSHDHASL